MPLLPGLRRTPSSGRTRLAARPGFSLLELLLAMVLIAIGLLVAAPSVSRITADSRLTNAATVVAGDLELARSLAGRHNVPIRIGYDEAAGEYRLTNRITGEVVHRRALTGEASEYGIEAASFSGTIEVYPSGLGSGALTVTLSIGDDGRQVALTRAGQVTISVVTVGEDAESGGGSGDELVPGGVDGY